MLPLKKIFYIFISLNFLGFFSLYYFADSVDERMLLVQQSHEPVIPDVTPRNMSSLPNIIDPKDVSKIYSISAPKDLYAFENTQLAKFVLHQLDVNSILPKIAGSNYSKPFMGIKHDQEYCKKARAYFAEYPHEIFENFNGIMDFPPSHPMRSTVLPLIGNDIQKHISVYQVNAIKHNFTYNLTSKVNGFFINDMVHYYHQIGKSFACNLQTYNHIPGHGTLNRKDKAAESLVNYSRLYEDRPQCFNSSKFFPKTWVLYIEDQCRDFFEHINSQAYEDLKKERTIVYIRKQGSGAHMAKGVQPVDDEEEQSIRDIWSNGEGCGTVKTNYIVQDFVHNPLLLLGHKFDFRIYMMVASSNPVIAFYHDGFLRVSVHKYDINSKDKSVLLTNTELMKKSFKQAAEGELVNGMNETELRRFQMWNFDALHQYLIETGKVKDPNWLDNYLRPEFKKAMIHLIRMAQGSFVKMSPLYEVFGADFMLDDNLNLWFLECNSSPVMQGSSEEKEKFMTTMLKDHFEVIIGLLRSRAKRVINYVNKVVREIEASKIRGGRYELKGLAKKQTEFKELSMNKFEPEFLPSPNNTWSMIIDENEVGAARYMNFIPEQCL